MGNQIIRRLHVGWEVNEKQDGRPGLMSFILARNRLQEQSCSNRLRLGSLPVAGEARARNSTGPECNTREWGSLQGNRRESF